MEKKNRNAVVWVVIVLVAIVGLWSLSNKWGGVDLSSLNPSYNNLSYSSSPTPTAKKTTPASPVPTAGITYEQAVVQYAGQRIQLNAACQGTPGQMVIKKGTKIMLDNRSKDTMTLRLDNQTVVLPGYNWRIMTINTTKTLPYDLGIDCKSSSGASENGAVLRIQANILQGL